MKGLLDFVWLWLRCALFIWLIAAILILILFAVGSEADGYSWAERLSFAAQYAAYVADIFGSLLAIYIWWQNWKITRRNKKTLARQKSKTS